MTGVRQGTSGKRRKKIDIDGKSLARMITTVHDNRNINICCWTHLFCLHIGHEGKHLTIILLYVHVSSRLAHDRIVTPFVYHRRLSNSELSLSIKQIARAPQRNLEQSSGAAKPSSVGHENRKNDYYRRFFFCKFLILIAFIL